MKSIVQPLIGFVFLIGLLSCSNSAKEETRPGADSTTPEIVNEDMGVIAEAFPEVYHFFSVSDSSFTPDKFIEVSKDSIRNSPESAVGPILKAYYPYFIFNTDSSFAIDLYSYNIHFVTKNGKTAAKAGGPDTEVGLVDMENKTRRRIFFGGPSSNVVDAQWLNNRAFLLMTGENAGTQGFIPSIIRYDINKDSLKRFVYDDTLKLKITDYHDPRIKIL